MPAYPILGGNEAHRNRPKMLMRHNVLEAYPGNLLDGVPGVDMYGARILASSFPGDIIMMPPSLSDRKLLDPIIEHYKRIGLEVANQFVFDENWDVALQHPEYELDAFHFGAAANTVAPNEAFAKIADEMNDKNFFIEFCRKLGIATPGTVLFGSAREFDAESIDLPGSGYPVYVKAAVSASGMHVICCENDEELIAAVGKMPGAFQIQEGLPPKTGFYNIQYTEVGGVRHHGPLTLQKLDGNEHNGNIFPAGIDADIVQPLADKLADAMTARGMKSTWAFDVAVTPTRGALFIEANPRWNGASYYSHPAERLRAKGLGRAIRVKPSHTNFDFMFRDYADWEYNPSHGSGIILINWGTIAAHKLGLLVIGTPEQRESLLNRFRSKYC